jgi:2-keto-4-pentenoate hydratase/2-oxohepta-3-ene-1,7-dioic acid hydratase in catechol pathway
VPKLPTILTCANGQVAHSRPIMRFKASGTLDCEGELAVVIRERGSHIAEADVDAHIAGYSYCNDGAIREFQRRTTQLAPGQNFPATGGFGPWVVRALWLRAW